METKLCIWCDEEKTLDRMCLNKRKPDGYDNKCRDCVREYQRIRKHGENYEYGDEDNYGALIKKQNEREVVDGLLTSLGYELNGDKPVYQQFFERYNLGD